MLTLYLSLIIYVTSYDGDQVKYIQGPYPSFSECREAENHFNKLLSSAAPSIIDGRIFETYCERPDEVKTKM